MGPRNSKPSRQQHVLLWGAITALALAGVIFGVSALSAPRSGSESGLKLSAAQQSAAAYDDGMMALASGDTTGALALFRKAIALDPTNAKADDEIRRIQDDSSGGGGQGDKDQTGTVPPINNPDSGFLDSVSDLASLLPAAVAGYALGEPLVAGSDAQRTGEPVADGPRSVRTVSFYVHDFATREAAYTFAGNQSVTAFPQNRADVTVNGIPAHFGTDGERFAQVVYARGRFVFEVILSPRPGSAPGSLLGDAVSAAEAFPVTR